MRVVVVGAGIAGLVAARQLDSSGVDVLVVDKGRSVGGRLATRRIGGATLDHGAQFFTVRTPAFGQRVEEWVQRGLVRVWSHGFTDDDGHPRFVAPAGMNSLAKDLAAPLDVETSTMVFAVRPATDRPGWDVVIDDGSARPADAVILTCPIPQTFGLLVDAGIDFDDPRLRVDYDRTLALLAVLDRAPSVPAPGGVQLTDDAVFSFIGDNAAKGVSRLPAVTFHASPEWSLAHWDDDPGTSHRALHDAATPWLGDAAIVESQLKRWRFARPQTVHPDPCLVLHGGSIVLGGDAFAGPRVEGAHNSGLACAHAVTG